MDLEIEKNLTKKLQKRLRPNWHELQYDEIQNRPYLIGKEKESDETRALYLLRSQKQITIEELKSIIVDSQHSSVTLAIHSDDSTHLFYKCQMGLDAAPFHSHESEEASSETVSGSETSNESEEASSGSETTNESEGASCGSEMMNQIEECSIVSGASCGSEMVNEIEECSIVSGASCGSEMINEIEECSIVSRASCGSEMMDEIEECSIVSRATCGSERLIDEVEEGSKDGPIVISAEGSEEVPIVIESDDEL